MRCRVFEIGEVFSAREDKEYTICDGKIYWFQPGDFKPGDLAVHVPSNVTVPASDNRFTEYVHLADNQGRIAVFMISPFGILLRAEHDWPLGHDLSVFLDVK